MTRWAKSRRSWTIGAWPSGWSERSKADGSCDPRGCRGAHESHVACLALLSRSQSLSSASDQAPQDRPVGTLRSHLHAQDRLRHSRSAARPAPCQQRRIADGTRSARDSAPHQRLGERHPLPSDETQDQRRYQKQHRTRLPRRLPRPRQNLRKAQNRLLGLSRLTPPNAKSPRYPVPAATHQAPLRHCMTATSFAPLTRECQAEEALAHTMLRQRCAEGSSGKKVVTPA